MESSDIDTMLILKLANICEDLNGITYNSDETYFKIDMEDVKPGFAKLRLIFSRDIFFIRLCRQSGSNLYLSNEAIISHFIVKTDRVKHGPCLSDKEGYFDDAMSLHCTSWITPARHWITRPNNEWPTDECKAKIIEHGVLFVPIGSNENAELEWRMSFSIGEKLLIYSFSHTQLLCYALMKILLKDVINRDPRCNGLLCSYFIKIIIFWLSEETPLSLWKPENLVPCFLQCFKRLIYCVQYSTCPHYFIPEYNLFELKIRGSARSTLLDNLNTLYSFNWRCIFFSKEFVEFQMTSFTTPNI